MARAQTIQIYLPSGDPAGIRIASITTRTVRVFDVPRSLLSEFLKRPEAGQVGVYYLFGSNDDETLQCYIGQSGNVGTRLQQHTATKDFWTRAMVAVSLTNEWTATHVAYLEWLSLQKSKQASRYKLLNGNEATNPFTPEPLEADCQEFIDTVAILLTTLGMPVLEPVKSVQISEGHAYSDELFLTYSDCDGTGYLTAEGMLVLAGSRGRSGLVPSAPSSIGTQRDALLSQGVIKIDGDKLVFVKDHLFSSPSAAGCVLTGRSTNGRTAWRSAQGLTINDLEQLALPATGDDA